MNSKIVLRVIASVSLALFTFVVFYLFLPLLSFSYTEGLVFIIFYSFVLLVFSYFMLSGRTIVEFIEKLGDLSSHNEMGVRVIRLPRVTFNIYMKLCVVGFALLTLVFILPIFSSTLFRSSEYYDVIDRTIEEVEFNQDFNSLNIETITSLPNIDSSLAQKKATTTFGETKGFGSEYQLGIFTDQIVDGKFVTVAPIEYNGFFKYNSNKANGTPGFVIVDKENYDTSNSGTKMYTNYNLKFLPSAYFSHDLERHIYFNGYAGADFVVSGFELDDELNPYWVVNIYENTIFPLGLKLISNVLLVDAQSGDIQKYSIEDVPSWVDNIQDSNVVMDMVNNYGKFENGFFNSIFAQTGVTQTTHGSRHVIVNGELHLFTGLTSVGADESISQIILVNKRTLKTSIYEVKGATEYVAMGSAEGKLQNYGYEATFPIPVNINNTPTYFIPLKDSSGLIKHYTFVQISNHTVIGAGATITEAYTNYVSLLSSSEGDDYEIVTGVIQRISFVDSIAYVYIDNKLYYMSNLTNSLIVVSKEGDNVTLKTIGNLIIDFTNNTLSQN